VEFDIISVTEEELNKYTAVQMQLLRTAQKKKNELIHKKAQDKALFKRLFMTNGTINSTLYSDKCREIEAEYDYQLEIIIEQLNYSLSSNSLTDDGGITEETGYLVDYTLSYTDRYKIVREYYMAIPDPQERLALYEKDEVAKKYLGSYYSTLYNVLYSYSL